MKNKAIVMSFAVLGFFLFAQAVLAQEAAPSDQKAVTSEQSSAAPKQQEDTAPKIDYGSGPILDSDLDGLTDKAEIEIFHTDPHNPDTDGDGFLDGAEILNGTDPLDNTSPAATKTVTETTLPVERPASWAWYVTRATGLLSFALLYIVMFLGLSMRTPVLERIVNHASAFGIHAWLSLQVLLLVLVHGGSLLFDKFFKFNLADILIPFVSPTYTIQIAAGILAMYLLIILILTSYFRRFMNYKLWRVIHFLNIAFYGMGVYHGLAIGTDLTGSIPREIFIWANVFLGVVILVNVFSRIFVFFRSSRLAT